MRDTQPNVASASSAPLLTKKSPSTSASPAKPSPAPSMASEAGSWSNSVAPPSSSPIDAASKSEVVEDLVDEQLALAVRVAGVDDQVDSRKEGLDSLEQVRGLDRQLPFTGCDGEVLELPRQHDHGIGGGRHSRFASVDQLLASSAPAGVSAKVDHIAYLDDPSRQLLAVVNVSGSLAASNGHIELPRAFFESSEANPFPAATRATRGIIAVLGHPLAFSFSGLVVGSVIYSLPFAVQPIVAGFAAVNPALVDAARLLGASTPRLVGTVLLPLARRSIVVAAVLSFLHTVGEFGVVLMLGGDIPGATRTLSIVLYDQVESFDYAAATRTAVVMLAMSLVALVVIYTSGAGRVMMRGDRRG